MKTSLSADISTPGFLLRGFANYHHVRDKGRRMAYALRFYIYLFVAGVIVTVIAVKLRPYGLLANIAFAIIAAYLAIKIGRRLLGRKHL